MSSSGHPGLLYKLQEAQSAASSWSSQTDVLASEQTQIYNQIKGDGVASRVHAPTKTAQTPPRPPARKDFAFSAAADTAETGTFIVVSVMVACSDGSLLCILIYYCLGEPKKWEQREEETHHIAGLTRVLIGTHKITSAAYPRPPSVKLTRSRCQPSPG